MSLRHLHSEDEGDAGLLHGDAVPDGGGFHRRRVVRDDDHLRFLPELAQQFSEALDICAAGGIMQA